MARLPPRKPTRRRSVRVKRRPPAPRATATGARKTAARTPPRTPRKPKPVRRDKRPAAGARKKPQPGVARVVSFPAPRRPTERAKRDGTAREAVGRRKAEALRPTASAKLAELRRVIRQLEGELERARLRISELEREREAAAGREAEPEERGPRGV